MTTVLPNATKMLIFFAMEDGVVANLYVAFMFGQVNAYIKPQQFKFFISGLAMETSGSCHLTR